MEAVSWVRLLRSIFAVLLVVLLVISSVSCVRVKSTTQSDNPSNPLANFVKKMLGKGAATAKTEYIEGVGEVMLTLTCPAGQSPKVFTQGWLFGASCIINQGKANQQDISKQVKWSGSGNFNPDTGETSRPSFTKAGKNSIVLTVTVGGKNVTREYSITAILPTNYAHVGDQAKCDHYALGCRACPHFVRGPIETGSPNVLIDNLPAARLGDKGQAAGGCGGATFEIMTGSPEVLIDGRPAARFGDETKHDGGKGKIAGGNNIQLMSPQFVQGSGSYELPKNYVENFIQTYLREIFKKIELEVGIDNAVSNRDQTVSLNMAHETGEITGNASVQVEGRFDVVTNEMKGTFSINAQTISQDKGKSYPLDLRYEGSFSSSKLNPDSATITLSYTGTIKSRGVIMLLGSAIGGISKTLGGKWNDDPNQPIPDTISKSYSCTISYSYLKK